MPPDAPAEPRAVDERFLDEAVTILSGDDAPAPPEGDPENKAADGFQPDENGHIYLVHRYTTAEGQELGATLRFEPGTDQSFIDKAKSDMDKARSAQQTRAKKWGIAVKDSGHITKPSDYSDCPDEKFADPVNYRYPCNTKARAKSAWSRWNDDTNQSKGGYSDDEWSKIGTRIKGFCSDLGVEISDDKEKAAPETASPVWADAENERFEIKGENDEERQAVFGEYVRYVADHPGEYSSEQQFAILRALTGGTQKKEAAAPTRKQAGSLTEKDVAEAFADALDTALDYGLLNVLEGAYSAWVKTILGGSYWDGDPDQLSRDEFVVSTGLLKAALDEIYDKLADSEEGGESLGDMATAALGLLDDGNLARMKTRVIAMGKSADSDPNAVDLALMHNGLVSLGYGECQPKQAESPHEPDTEEAPQGQSDDATEPEKKDKALDLGQPSGEGEGEPPSQQDAGVAKHGERLPDPLEETTPPVRRRYVARPKIKGFGSVVTDIERDTGE